MKQVMASSISPEHVDPESAYLQFLKEFDGRHVEWVGGHVVEMHQVTSEHQDILGCLLSTLLSFAEEKRLGRVLYRPFQMKTGHALPGRAPDLMFVASARCCQMKKMFLNGPADPDWFWANPLPSTLSILRLWGLI